MVWSPLGVLSRASKSHGPDSAPPTTLPWAFPTPCHRHHSMQHRTVLHAILQYPPPTEAAIVTLFAKKEPDAQQASVTRSTWHSSCKVRRDLNFLCLRMGRILMGGRDERKHLEGWVMKDQGGPSARTREEAGDGEGAFLSGITGSRDGVVNPSRKKIGSGMEQLEAARMDGVSRHSDPLPGCLGGWWPCDIPATLVGGPGPTHSICSY